MAYDNTFNAYLEAQKQKEQLLKNELEGSGPIIDMPVSKTGNPGMSAQQKQQFDQAEIASLGTAGASGAMMGGPAGAGIMVGGQLASSYLNNKAAAERQRRERAAQIAEQYGQDQYKGFQMAQDALRGALR